jgi:hypothetical protein
MWFLLFSLGAVLLGAVGLPAARRLPAAPPPEALVACYFLLAALLRMLVRDARLSAFERKARREARRQEDKKKPTSLLGELGLGVGRGALQVVGGDVLGAGLSLASALLRGAASSITAPPPPQRERRRAARWEQLKAVSCITGVGLVCAGVAWEPLVHTRLVRVADAAVKAGMDGPTGNGGLTSPVQAQLAAPIPPPVAAPVVAEASAPALAPASGASPIEPAAGSGQASAAPPAMPPAEAEPAPSPPTPAAPSPSTPPAAAPLAPGATPSRPGH